jgi:transcriptional regulator with XRE-family HTH domain
MTGKTLILKAFVLEQTKERNLSLRQFATELGISHSYLSEILNGKKSLDISLGNKIADFFNIQRVTLYKAAGWLDLNEDDAFLERFKEYAKKNPDFAEIVETILNIKDEKERKQLLRLFRAGLEK